MSFLTPFRLPSHTRLSKLASRLSAVSPAGSPAASPAGGLLALLASILLACIIVADRAMAAPPQVGLPQTSSIG